MTKRRNAKKFETFALIVSYTGLGLLSLSMVGVWLVSMY